jgi:[acyl-carrier-protein] S-malonyltransferase
VIALLVPGQGAQQVGMGQALAERFPSARAAFEEADDVLGRDLSGVCFAGPAERLTATDVCQPALLATSVAAWRAAAEAGLAGDLALGHSLGEFSALVACGSLGYADALRLVAERGAAMQAANDERAGTMAALIGLDDAAAEALCAEVEEVWPANYNAPGQVVASGSVAGIERLVALAGERGVRATRLQVGGAFHSPLMAPAAERLREALEGVPFASPVPAFLSTTTVAPEPPERLRAVLASQLTAPVRFRAAVETAIAMGATRFVELGPGRVLSGLVRRVRRGAETVQVGTPDDLDALRGPLAGEPTGSQVR